MNTFLRIDINLAALIMLGLVFSIGYRNLDRRDKLNKKFLTTSLIIILEIIFETATCILNKRPEQMFIIVSKLIHTCLFFTAPILTYSWFSFIYTWVTPEERLTRIKRVLLLVPVLINSVITFLSPFYGLVFYITKENVYNRGSFFIISAVITYIYLILSFFVILKQRRKIVKQDFIPILIFGIFPILGGILQTMFYGILLMWSSSAFSLVIVYNLLQQRMVHIDGLTGVWTRSSFDYYISMRIKNNDDFGVIFIDIDGLKNINDEFGHVEGDEAIKNAVNLITDILRKTDVIARWGGDEFIIMLDNVSKDDLSEVLDRINSRFAKYNGENTKGYKLECSFGADLFNKNFSSIEQFLNHVDALMYCNKNIRKSLSF
ncbi:MAG: diguanylate cyclase domain-containing protein [Solirubrobacterales bacterium]